MTHKERELELLTASLQESVFLLSGKRPLFTTDFREAVCDLMQALQERKFSELGDIRDALEQIDWSKVEKAAAIAHNLAALNIPKSLYASQTSEAVFVCLSEAKPFEYQAALLSSFGGSKGTSARKKAALALKFAASFVAVWGALLPPGSPFSASETIQNIANHMVDHPENAVDDDDHAEHLEGNGGELRIADYKTPADK